MIDGMFMLMGMLESLLPCRSGKILSGSRESQPWPIIRRQPRTSANVSASKASSRFALKSLADESLRFVQLEEALGRPPELKKFGLPKFERMALNLDNDVNAAWTKYVAAIEVAKRSTAPLPEAVRSSGVNVGSRRAPRSDSSTDRDSASDAREVQKPKGAWFSRLFGGD